MKRRFVVVGAILLGTVLAGSAVVEAWGPGAWFGRGGGCGPSMHHGLRGAKDMQDFFLYRLDQKVSGLNLNAAQKEKYNELRTSIKAHFARALEERKALKASVHAEMAKDVPDMTGLTGKLKAKVQEGSATIQKNLDLFAAFYTSLDNDQKKQVVSEIKERMAGHEREQGRMAP